MTEHLYRTADSSSGPRLPHSGFLLGKLAEVLRLKHLYEGDDFAASYKTVQRYFAGWRIDPATVELVVEALIEGLVPDDLMLPAAEVGRPISAREAVSTGLRTFLAHWDMLVADFNAHHFTVAHTRHLIVPVLRLGALDVGLRLAAWLSLMECRGEEVRHTMPPWVLEERGVASWIDALRSARGWSLEKLADELLVSTQAIGSWRSGESLPTHANLETLAVALSPSREAVGRTIMRLRVGIAVRDAFAQLATAIAPRPFPDFINVASRVAHLGLRGHHAMPVTHRPRLLWEIVIHGARCPAGFAMASALADVAKHAEVHYDLLALTRRWADRLRYWTDLLATAEEDSQQFVEYIRRRAPGRDTDAEKQAKAALDAQLMMTNFHTNPFMPRVVPPELLRAMPAMGQAMFHAMVAAREWSIGAGGRAVEAQRQACAVQPNNPVLHFRLGCYLGQLGLSMKDSALIDEAVAECRIAVAQAPSFANARNEIAIILSNARRHEDAEAAFADAEPFHGGHAHHWHARGQNLVPLGRYEDALAMQRRAVELTADGKHLAALCQQAALLMKLGRTRDAKRIGKRVHHLTGVDPTESWEEILNIWRDTNPGLVH